MEIVEVPGYSMYGVTEDGSVWSRKSGSWKQMRLTENGHGYLRVKFADQSQHKAHHLVMLTFVGPRPKDLIVNHRDGDKKNNHLSNLEYCTYRENSAHARMTGLSSPPPNRPRLCGVRGYQKKLLKGTLTGSAVKGSKLSDCDIRAIRDLRQGGSSLGQISAVYGISRNTVDRIAKRIKWKHID